MQFGQCEVEPVDLQRCKVDTLHAHIGKIDNFDLKKSSFKSKNEKKNIGASQTSFSKPFLGSRMVFETIFKIFFFHALYSIAWPWNFGNNEI